MTALFSIEQKPDVEYCTSGLYHKIFRVRKKRSKRSDTWETMESFKISPTTIEEVKAWEDLHKENPIEFIQRVFFEFIQRIERRLINNIPETEGHITNGAIIYLTKKEAKKYGLENNEKVNIINQ